MPIEIPENLEIIDHEPQVETLDQSEATANESVLLIIPNFKGDIMVTFPETEVKYVFVPVETLRAKGDKKWKYPSPVPVIREQLKELPAILHKYSELLGVSGIVDMIEESINANCQSKWKQAVKLEEKDLSKAPVTFASIFHEGRTREAVTSAGLFKKSEQYRKLFMEEKTKNGITDKAKEFYNLAKDYNVKAMEQSQKEMMALEMETAK